MSRTTKATLLSISLFAAYAKYYQSFRIDFIRLLSTMADTQSLSGLPGQLYCNYTGLSSLDQFLRACNVFFWPVFQGGMPTLSLYGLAFASAMVPMWLVIVVETNRRKRPFVALLELAFIAGPLIQCLGPGLTMPAMLAFHDSKLPFASDLGLFPSSMILGYILPLSFAALPAPGILAYDTKQQFIAIWQGWPLYTSLIMGVFRCLEVSQHRQLKTACAFAFACSAAGHLVFLWLSWAKTTSHHIYLPPAPWGEPQVTTLEAGVLRFLQWDYTCSACGMLVWTGATYRQATRKRSLRSFWALLIAGMVGVILLGPFSVAMVLYWETLTLVTTKGRQKL